MVGVVAAGWKPLLGLDLQGGLSVVLKPTTSVDDDQLAQAIEIIRNRVDALGVVEPDISRQGQNIVVELPGVKDQQRALDLVGTTAELRFRPVLAFLGPPPGAEGATTTTAPVAGQSSPIVIGDPTTSTAGGASTTATSAATTTSVPTSTSEASFGATGGAGEFALGPVRAQSTAETTAPASTTTAPSTTVAAGTPTTAAAGDTTGTTAPAVVTDTTVAPIALPDLESLTTREEDKAEATVVLAEYKDGKEVQRFLLGPALATGEAVASATRALNPNDGSPYVALTFKDGDKGVGAWRRAAGVCFSQDQGLCPTKSLAIVLDGEVISAPQVNDDFSDTNEATITGSFGQQGAKDLATSLKYGALPVALERQQAQEVSPTVGEDTLRAGLIAGLIGLALASLYICAFYRVLGLVAIGSLLTAFALLWAVISWLGEKEGLALSLAGVVGIIVSIGVALDSNIVYYEVIKEDMKSGRNLRSSVERSFRNAWRTILRADFVSLIAAVLLYILTVGSVRNFAFYLGLATILDLIASYYFMRPVVNLMARSGWANKLSLFGLKQHEPVAAGVGA